MIDEAGKLSVSIPTDDVLLYFCQCTGWSKKDGNICFPYQRKTVHGICIILRILGLRFMEISLAYVWILQVAFYCIQEIIQQSIYFSPVHSFVKNLTMWHRFWALCKPERRHWANPFWIIWRKADAAEQVQDHNLVCVEWLNNPVRKFTRLLEAES